jgi:thioredoxin reductase
MRDVVDVAVVGAGPYGLSVTAHLRSLGLSVRTFGKPMNLWQSAMPSGMFLKSQPFASNLSDPAHAYTLEAFSRESGIPYVSYGVPVALETFVAYGNWFQRKQVPDLEEVLITNIAREGNTFVLSTGEGDTARARTVVVAVGVEHFAHLPEPYASLPRQICTHASAHVDLRVFKDSDVTFIGGGQSALESAALASEHGANVRVVIRAPELRWNGAPLPPDRPFLQQLREPEAGLGSGWTTWFYSTRADMFTYLPAVRRAKIARTALGPAGAHWLRSRVEGKIQVLRGHAVVGVDSGKDKVRLRLRDGSRRQVEIVTDHVIAATGYRPDLRRLGFLDTEIASRLDRNGEAPRVDRDFQSSVPGLYFVGPAVASTFGPAMRFVYGSDFAARRLSTRLARNIGRQHDGVRVPA